MRRKVIRQKDSYTITLPKKWVEEHNAASGVDVDFEGEHLLIATQNTPKKSGALNTKIRSEAFLRYALNNAYRSGYDKLTLTCPKKFHDFIEQHLAKLLGWKIVDKTRDSLVIESLAEPSPEQFDLLLRRSFYVFQEAIRYLQVNWEKSLHKLERASIEISTTDNFLRRCISKRAVDREKTHFFWHFISTITWAFRGLLHASQESKPQRDIAKLLVTIEESLRLLHEGYAQANVDMVAQSFDLSRSVMERKIRVVPANVRAYHFLLESARMLNLCCSPLLGIIL